MMTLGPGVNDVTAANRTSGPSMSSKNVSPGIRDLRASCGMMAAADLAATTSEVFMTEATFAARLRWWREHRNFSQLELAGRTDVSQRHLSFLELGRASPSREM